MQEVEAELEISMKAQSELQAKLKAAEASATEQAFLLRQISVAANTTRAPVNTPRRSDPRLWTLAAASDIKP